jgi:D-threo-aldose 1-dehydrogenase
LITPNQVTSRLSTRALGRTGLKVTELGFGSAPLGGFRGSVSEERATATLRTAWGGGVRYFDTAPYYGYGRSELRVGALLRDLPRESYVLSTKVGRVLRPLRDHAASPARRTGGLDFDADYDYGYDGTMRSVEQSMLRTGVTRFDVLLIHDLDTFTHPDQQVFERHYVTALDGAIRALQELRASGVVRAIGAGLNEAPTCARLLRDTDLDCVLLAGRFTLLDQSACDEVLPLCRAKGIALIAGGPFNSGILAVGARDGAPYHYRPAAPDIIERVRRLDEIACAHGVPLQAVALKFALMCPEVAAVVPGAMSAEEQVQILSWHATSVPSAFWRAVVSENLVRADAMLSFANAVDTP